MLTKRTTEGLKRHFSVYFRTRSAYSSPQTAQLVRNTLTDINQLYQLKQKISVVTGHDYITGKFAEQSGIDINLIGDSLAMVALGYEDTNEIGFDEFLYHVKSVSRGNKKSFLVADVPFGSYEKSIEQAVDTAVKLVKEGRIQGIKIEGGKSVAPTIAKITSVGIPVMGHTGLTPQQHNALGGFKLQGNTVKSALQVYEDCLALQEAGAFAIVLECIPNKVSEYITNKLKIPTIGIGAGPHTSGQVLVMADLLGMTQSNEQKQNSQPKFVKNYLNIYDQSIKALEQYQGEVKSDIYPNADQHGYKLKGDVLKEFKRLADEL